MTTPAYSDSVLSQQSVTAATFNVGTVAENDVIIICCFKNTEELTWDTVGRAPSYDGDYVGESSTSGKPTLIARGSSNNIYSGYMGYIICTAADDGNTRTVTVPRTSAGSNSPNHGHAMLVQRYSAGTFDHTSLIHTAGSLSSGTTDANPENVNMSAYSVGSGAGTAFLFVGFRSGSPYTIAAAGGGSWVMNTSRSEDIASCNQDAAFYLAEHPVSGAGTLANLTTTIDTDTLLTSASTPMAIRVVFNNAPSTGAFHLSGFSDSTGLL